MCLSRIPRLLLFPVKIRISAMFKGTEEGKATRVLNVGYRTLIRSLVSLYTLHHHQRPRGQELCNEIYKYHRANCILFTINHSQRACLPACPWARICLLSYLASSSSQFSPPYLYFSYLGCLAIPRFIAVCVYSPFLYSFMHPDWCP